MERLAAAPAPRSDELLAIPPVSMTAEDEKLAARIERAVRRGTSDKVRELRVEVRWDGVHLMGRCGTFYCKQLAQTAALAMTGKWQLHNRIEVW
jgi:osmotically-inducible protein OsmY